MHGRAPDHYAYINALRGWAIFAVLIVHTSQHVPGIEARAFWIAEEGARGVQLFFVASALTLMLSWRSRDDGALPFYIRRLFRIAPMFWLAIVGYYLLRGADRGFWAPGGLTWWHISLTAAFLHGWHPATITSVVPGGWSIAVEMTFYAIFPLLIVWCSTFQKTCLAFAISLALLPLMNYLGFVFYDAFESPPPDNLMRHFLFLWFWNQLPVFLIGIATYHLVQMVRGQKSRAPQFLAGAFAVLLAALLEKRFPTLAPVIPQHVICALGFMLLAAGLSVMPLRLLVNRAICRLGVVSYSAYIWHFAVLDALTAGGLPTAFVMGGPVWVYFIAHLLLVTAITAAVSEITYRWIETPMNRVGRRTAERLSAQERLRERAA